MIKTTQSKKIKIQLKKNKIQVGHFLLKEAGEA
jgi:hypothetical protein